MRATQIDPFKLYPRPARVYPGWESITAPARVPSRIRSHATAAPAYPEPLYNRVTWPAMRVDSNGRTLLFEGASVDSAAAMLVATPRIMATVGGLLGLVLTSRPLVGTTLGAGIGYFFGPKLINKIVKVTP